MIARWALAAMLIATVPMIGATYADAAPRDGKSERTAKRAKSATVKSATNRSGRRGKNSSSAQKASDSKSTSRKYSRFNGNSSGHGKVRNWKHRRYGHAFKGKRSFRRHSCSAVAKTRGGYGKRLWGIGGMAYGRGACDQAMHECRRGLRYRKTSGRNPFAKCVIVARR